MNDSTQRALRILIVEDDLDDYFLLRHAFRLLPFVVECRRADTPTNFVAQLESLAPDVILCDVHLPHFDAASAVGIAIQKAPTTPVLLVSGLLAPGIDEQSDGQAFSKQDVAALLDALAAIARKRRA